MAKKKLKSFHITSTVKNRCELNFFTKGKNNKSALKRLVTISSDFNFIKDEPKITTKIKQL